MTRRFGLLEIPALYIYPGEGDRRVRWENASSRPLTAEEQAALPALAEPELAAAVKRTRGVIKNTLAPKFLAALVSIGRLGAVGDANPSTARLVMLPEEIPAGSALFGLLFYDEGDRALRMHPYSVVTRSEIIRLQF